MPDSPQPTACASCRADLINVAFVVDKKGRGICKPCVAKLKAKQKAKAEEQAKANAAGDGDVMGILLADSAASTKTPCPECQAYITPESVVCIHCGYNIASGKQMKTRFIAAPKEKEAKAKGGSSLELTPKLVGFLAALATAAPLALGFVDEPLFTIGIMLGALVYSGISLALWITTLIDGQIKWTILLILCGGIGHVIYILTECQRARLGAAWLGSFAGLILAIGAFFALGTPGLETPPQ